VALSERQKAFFHDTVTVYTPQKMHDALNEIIEVYYTEAASVEVKGMLYEKSEFEEASLVGKLVNPGASFSVHKLGLHSDVSVVPGTLFYISGKGWFEAVTAPAVYDWRAKSQTVEVKVVGEPTLR